jgi:heme-degrading monooxygenase HmoA
MPYVVVFRSTVRPGADRELMRALDEAAHQEALASGGLLDYVAGSDDGARASVCVWETEEDAKRAARLPAHVRAVRHASEFYSEFAITTYGGTSQSTSAPRQAA